MKVQYNFTQSIMDGQILLHFHFLHIYFYITHPLLRRYSWVDRASDILQNPSSSLKGRSRQPGETVVCEIQTRQQKVFTLFIEALYNLRAEAKCTTVCGRRINIFLYSPRTHFSSVKHVLIINLFNTHTHSICWVQLPFKLTSTAATESTVRLWNRMRYFYFLLCTARVCLRHTHPCANLHTHTPAK